jgi:hypothetical protein
MRFVILCPANAITGGPEALHQLCAMLRLKGAEAAMHYFGREQSGRAKPAVYDEYDTVETHNVEDQPDSAVVAPETRPQLLAPFKRARRCLWWLSVDNYLSAAAKRRRSAVHRLRALVQGSEPNIADPRLVHMVQSAYADDFVRRNGGHTVLPVSDYINSKLLADSNPDRRHDIVLFNPKKGMEFTRKIMTAYPEFVFMPLQGLDHAGMRAVLGSAKLYIDFGHHPGKDRMPREAARAGCCILTSRSGSAGYQADMPVPDDCKFEASESQIPAIGRMIDSIFSNFSTHTGRFDRYRHHIAAEKATFETEVGAFIDLLQRTQPRSAHQPASLLQGLRRA